MTRDEWYAITAELIAADEVADPRRLAAIAWRGRQGRQRASGDRSVAVRPAGGPSGHQALNR